MFKLHRMAYAIGGRPMVYLALVVVVTGAIMASALALFRQGLASVDALLAANQAPVPHLGETVTRRGEVQLSQDDWNERIQTKDFWSGRGGSGGGSAPFVVRSNLQGPPPAPPVTRASLTRPESGRFYDGDGSSYRTVCVRLCDGYFFPISSSTSHSNFKRDQHTCESSCNSPAKLYVYKNSGEEPTDMRDVDGQPYSRLKTANLYRTKYEAQCKCKADPWDKEAMDRHRLYALDSAILKGDKVAAQNAAALKAQMAADAAARRGGTGSKVGVLNSFTTTIVAANPNGETDETTTTEAIPAPAPINVAKPAPKPSNSKRPPQIMKLGAGSDSSNSGAPRPVSISRSPERWRSNAFQGN